ncbi:hypothetical protein BOTBODRAFT_29797 [Botryobasidium botryosum FD-172 SS1]|uniref:Uncharacterized protein n=1 Tax=Botryobasidium botryosum (strain FD-172 SS1) TaxID=930990 RepID=A0A067N0C9_BOTB1|nr:hypothetical protein BOTBODRAFT_29797 [Botryobasidium botryosum FD-172 SS1]
MEMVRVPTIVVFTKYDRLFNQIVFKTDGALLKGMDENEIGSFVDKQTEEKLKGSVAVVKQMTFHDMYARLIEQQSTLSAPCIQGYFLRQGHGTKKSGLL